VPPIYVILKKNFHVPFLRGRAVGFIGAGNGSGWIERDFLTYIKHFAKHAKPSKDNIVLLLFDDN
jgi:hypothetical protein